MSGGMSPRSGTLGLYLHKKSEAHVAHRCEGLQLEVLRAAPAASKKKAAVGHPEFCKQVKDNGRRSRGGGVAAPFDEGRRGRRERPRHRRGLREGARARERKSVRQAEQPRGGPAHRVLRAVSGCDALDALTARGRAGPPEDRRVRSRRPRVRVDDARHERVELGRVREVEATAPRAPSHERRHPGRLRARASRGNREDAQAAVRA